MNLSEFSQSALGALAALLSSLTWAIGVMAYAELTKKYAPAMVNFARALFSFPLFFLAASVIYGGPLDAIGAMFSMGWSNSGWLILSLFGSYVLGDIFFLMSTAHMGVPGAMAIASTYPLWSALAGWIFRGQALTHYGILGLLLVVCGVIVVILSGREGISKKKEQRYFFGVFLALLTSLFWSLNTFSVSKVGAVADISVANSFRMLFALFLCPLAGKIINPSPIKLIKWVDLKKYLVFFFLESFAGAYLYMYGLGHSPLAVGSALSSVVPAFSAPIAWMTGTEKFSGHKFFGIIMVLVGTILLIVKNTA